MTELDADRQLEVLDGLDAVEGDMADAQRAVGKMPTPAENRELAAAEFAKLEKQGAFHSKPAPGPIENLYPPKPGAETKDVNGKKYKLTRDGDTNTPLEQAAAEKAETLLILKRVLFLLKLQETGPLGAPSFKQRVVKILDRCGGTMGSFMRSPGRVARELDELLEESNKYFGDWRNPDSNPIVGG